MFSYQPAMKPSRISPDVVSKQGFHYSYRFPAFIPEEGSSCMLRLSVNA
jgi:hypothetical protein